MRNGPLLIAIVMVCASSNASPLTAQVPVVLNGYAGVALPQGDWKEDGAETGWGYGASIAFRPLPMVGIYGGWDRFRFGIASDASLNDVDGLTFFDSGMSAGVELNLPLPHVSPFVSGGLFYGETELEVREGDITSRFRTGSDLGFEAGVGVVIDVGSFAIRPRVGYRTRDAEFGSYLGETGQSQSTISHLNITIGASLAP